MARAVYLKTTDLLTARFGNLQRLKSALPRSSSCANYITRCCILAPGLKDWIELLAALDASGIRYLIVGGIAVGFHAEPRYTKDLDLLIAVREPDQIRLFKCLAEFGAPVEILKAEEFLQEDFVFHFGIPPWRVDVLTSVPGVDFELAYADRVPMSLGDYSATCISRDWLIRAKRASGRPQDLLDLEHLENPK